MYFLYINLDLEEIYMVSVAGLPAIAKMPGDFYVFQEL